MGKKCPEPDCPKCLPGWLAAFGDLMSLLLCFFVLLLSMSTMDAKKVAEAAASLNGALSVLEGGTKVKVSPERQQETTPIDAEDEQAQKMKTLKRTIVELNEMSKAEEGGKATLEEAENGFMIRLPAKLLFRPGSASIDDDDALLFLKRIALIIQKLPANMRIHVIGHTDDSRPVNSPFRDNWELSAARAISVTKILVKNRVEPKLLTACGKAEYDPIASNLTAAGKERNRRVELYFFSKDEDNREHAKKSILDSAAGG